MLSMSPNMLFITLIITITAAQGCTTTSHELPFPAILVFGDSTVDSGNNNYIPTVFRGDHPPYGLDFPGRVPTGRFSNGKLVPDILASIIGLKESVPPFLDPNLSDEDVATGVSFASAGSGYDELTTLLSGVIPMSEQPGYLKEYIERVESIVGEKEGALRIVSNALVIISAGTNDFIFNFYDLPTRRIEFSIDEYQDFVLGNLQNVVKEIYRIGGRKMMVTGLPPIGCLPIQRKMKSRVERSCSEEENEDAQSYNHKLQKMVQQMERELWGSRILYVDIYNPLMDIINHPRKYGFVEIGRGCCGTGVVEAGPLCTPLTPLCPNSSQYMFYDTIHPTLSTYTILSFKLANFLSHFHTIS